MPTLKGRGDVKSIVNVLYSYTVDVSVALTKAVVGSIVAGRATENMAEPWSMTPSWSLVKVFMVTSTGLKETGFLIPPVI